MKAPGGSRRRLPGGTCAVLAVLAACPGVILAQSRPAAIAIQPLEDPAPPSGSQALDPDHDAAPLLAHLVLSVTPGIPVRWRPVDPGGPGVLALLPVPPDPDHPEAQEPDPDDPRSPSPSVEGARRMLESLPKRWRKRSLKLYRGLGLATLDERRAEILVKALAARAAGDPLRASEILAGGGEDPDHPILRYLLAVSHFEAGSLDRAAAAIGEPKDSLRGLPGPLVKMAGALVAAAAGERKTAASLAKSAADAGPALAEPWLLLGQLSRTWCDLYDQASVLRYLDNAVTGQPCCALGALDLAQVVAFTDRPAAAPGLVRADAGCAGAPLDSSRDRALALAQASSGAIQEGLEAADRAQARDVSALRNGLAPTYLILEEPGRLAQAYDSEADLRLSPEISYEHHLWAGLGDLWRGRPSSAAEQFARAEEHGARRAGGDDTDLLAVVQWARTMRIRAYLAAGRVEEARMAAAQAREAGRGRMNGLLIYTTALTDLAVGDTDAAITWTRRLTPAGLKFWRYMLSAEIAMSTGKFNVAQSSLSLAAQGIGLETTVCPGISMEPYVLHSQARTLLGLGRHEAAEHLLTRLIKLGSRGVLAPEILVPAWELVAEARRARGDAEGAAAAYRELLDRWGDGEDVPVTQRARKGLEHLESARQAGHPGPRAVPEGPPGEAAALIYNERASEPALIHP